MADVNYSHRGFAANSIWQRAAAVAALVAALAAGTLVATNDSGTFDTVAGGMIPVATEGGDLGAPSYLANTRRVPIDGWPGETV